MPELPQWVSVALFASKHHHFGQSGTIWCPATFEGTTGQAGRFHIYYNINHLHQVPESTTCDSAVEHPIRTPAYANQRNKRLCRRFSETQRFLSPCTESWQERREICAACEASLPWTWKCTPGHERWSRRRQRRAATRTCWHGSPSGRRASSVQALHINIRNWYIINYFKQ